MSSPSSPMGVMLSGTAINAAITNAPSRAPMGESVRHQKLRSSGSGPGGSSVLTGRV